MPDDGKEFDLDIKDEGARFKLDPFKVGEPRVKFWLTQDPCGTPNPPVPPTHIYIDVPAKGVLDIDLNG